jgi:hypothetical protein
MARSHGDRFDVRVGGNVSGQVVAGHGNISHLGHSGGDEKPVLPDLRGAGRVIVVADVQDSGRLDSRQQRHMRRELRHIFRDGAAAMHRQWEDFEPSDRGDGLRLVVSPEVVPLPTVLDAFVTCIAGTFTGRMKALDPAARFKLRISVHFGFVDRSEGEWSGAPLVHAARLIDAAEAKRMLGAAENGSLALIVSDDVYQQVIRNGYTRLGPGEYQRIRVTEKETSTDAWVRLV